jgi:hypothetical protein
MKVLRGHVVVRQSQRGTRKSRLTVRPTSDRSSNPRRRQPWQPEKTEPAVFSLAMRAAPVFSERKQGGVEVVGAVTVSLGGREGQVRYSEGPLRVIDGYFEFGGNAVLAIITFGSLDEWRRLHPWAAERRPEILRFIAAELVRQQAPNTIPDIDEGTGVILLRQGAGAVPPPARIQARAQAKTQAAAFVWRLGNLRATLGLAVLAGAVILGGLALLGREVMTQAQPPGAPLNESLRYEGGVATLLSRADPQGPQWSGRGGGETVTVSLLVIPFDGAEPRQTVLVRGVSSGSVSLGQVLGSDGTTLWTSVDGLTGVRLTNGTLVTAEDLRRANSGLDQTWLDDARGVAVSDGRLHIVRRDGSGALDVDPATLRAQATPRRATPPRLSRPAPAEAIAARFLTTDGAWLGLHTAKERAGSYAVGRWVRPVEDADKANTDRFLTRATLEPSSNRTRFRIRSSAPTSEAPYLNAGFLRLGPTKEPLRLQGPPGALMVHTGSPARSGTLLVSRVDEDGSLLWTADTGLDRFTLRQMLPGERVSAFVGARPSEPGRLSEPLVVLVAHDTGAVSTHTLGR